MKHIKKRWTTTVLLLASGHLSHAFGLPWQCFFAWWAEYWTKQIHAAVNFCHVSWHGFGGRNNLILYSVRVETRIWLYFLCPCIRVHSLCSIEFPTHVICRTGGIRTTERGSPFLKPCCITKEVATSQLRIATSPLRRNYLLRVVTFTCSWIEDWSIWYT